MLNIKKDIMKKERFNLSFLLLSLLLLMFHLASILLYTLYTHTIHKTPTYLPLIISGMKSNNLSKNKINL